MSKNSKKNEENEKLIQIAVKFLSNPKVEPTSDEVKKNFLKKKGLSDENIQKAFELYKKSKEAPAKEEKSIPNSDNIVGEAKKPETVEEKIESAKKSNFLSLKKMGLTKLPATVFELQNLQTLIISSNDIEAIPDEIGNLKKLRIFHAVDCKLTSDKLPVSFFTLPSLIELNFSKNQLSSIEGVENLKTLMRLDLSENQLLELTSNIEQLENLESLNLRDNNLSDLPSGLGNLKKLKRLMIKDNNLDNKLVDAVKEKGVQGLLDYIKNSY